MSDAWLWSEQPMAAASAGPVPTFAHERAYAWPLRRGLPALRAPTVDLAHNDLDRRCHRDREQRADYPPQRGADQDRHDHQHPGNLDGAPVDDRRDDVVLYQLVGDRDDRPADRRDGEAVEEG